MNKVWIVVVKPESVWLIDEVYSKHSLALEHVMKISTLPEVMEFKQTEENLWRVKPDFVDGFYYVTIQEQYVHDDVPDFL